MKNPRPKLFKTALVTLILALFATCLVQATSAQVSGNTIVRVQPSTNAPRVGEAFIVSVTIENVQNLYGLDVTLRWNDSVLQFQSLDLRLAVESHPDGVLHEDSNTEIYIVENEASGAEYHLVATSVGPASSFNGSGTIVNINFKAISIGHSALELETELADHPAPEEPANFIEHTDVPGSVESTENQNHEPSGTDWLIPILVALAIIVLIIVIVAIVYSRKR